MRYLRHQAGFTLIELLMAMAVFSFMLLIVTAGFIQVVRIHQAGIASRGTQQNVRLIMDDVMKAARPSGKVVAVQINPYLSRVCFSQGSQILMYQVDTTTNNLREGLTVDPTCVTTTFSSTPRIVNDPTVAVERFLVSTTAAVGTGLGTAQVTLTAASVDNLTSLDTTTKSTCLPGTGSQFCAVATITSLATLRGGEGL